MLPLDLLGGSVDLLLTLLTTTKEVNIELDVGDLRVEATFQEVLVDQTRAVVAQGLERGGDTLNAFDLAFEVMD